MSRARMLGPVLASLALPVLPHAGVAEAGRRPFGALPDGRAVEAGDLSGGDTRVTVLTLGAAMPGLRVFAGDNYLGIIGKGSIAHAGGQGVALEPQMFPDAPNHADFPSIVLRPGQTYRARIEYHFSITPAARP